MPEKYPRKILKNIRKMLTIDREERIKA